jgi:hypothetical protein
MAGERIVGVMNKVRGEDKSDTTDLVFGTVTSINPLKIWIDNRFEITPEFIILSALCKETPLWRGLQVGDKVRIIRYNKGQSFYVMEREDGII